MPYPAPQRCPSRNLPNPTSTLCLLPATLISRAHPRSFGRALPKVCLSQPLQKLNTFGMQYVTGVLVDIIWESRIAVAAGPPHHLHRQFRLDRPNLVRLKTGFRVEFSLFTLATSTFSTRIAPHQLMHRTLATTHCLNPGYLSPVSRR